MGPLEVGQQITPKQVKLIGGYFYGPLTANGRLFRFQIIGV
jgi:hypothetical protein